MLAYDPPGAKTPSIVAVSILNRSATLTISCLSMTVKTGAAANVCMLVFTAAVTSSPTCPAGSLPANSCHMKRGWLVLTLYRSVSLHPRTNSSSDPTSGVEKSIAANSSAGVWYSTTLVSSGLAFSNSYWRTSGYTALNNRSSSSTSSACSLLSAAQCSVLASDVGDGAHDAGASFSPLKLISLIFFGEAQSEPSRSGHPGGGISGSISVLRDSGSRCFIARPEP
mmetsp:Transcript_8720/g.20003  ORF Transcript_8720/g.20003 Transcript_8720/m.20003 type:complete len:225 (+) Transcript_8720:1253-1927(+)